jgi:Tol biopolymer transport system component
VDRFDPDSIDPSDREPLAAVIIGPSTGPKETRRRRIKKGARISAALAALVLLGAVFGPPHRDDTPPTVQIAQPTEAARDSSVDTYLPTATAEPIATGDASVETASPKKKPVETVPPPGPKLQEPPALGVVAMSWDSRYVAFNSQPSKLFPSSEPKYDPIDGIVYDREAGTVEVVTVGDDGERIMPGPDAYLGDMSANGRYVVFTTGLDGKTQVYVRDRISKRTTQVSVSNSGEPADDMAHAGVPQYLSISSDGRYVAFNSPATNLVPDDTNGAMDVFVHDTLDKITERVSVSSSGEQAEKGVGRGFSPDISANGRYVVFVSNDANLVSNPLPMCRWGNADYPCNQVFLRDRQTGTTTLASISSDGEPSNGINLFGATVSSDGRYIAFDSSATNLDPSASNSLLHSYVHDRQTGKTVMVRTATYEGGVPITAHSVRISNTPTPMLGFRDELFAGAARDVVTGEERDLPGFPVAFSADGRLIALVTEQGISLYNWSTRKSEPLS